MRRWLVGFGGVAAVGALAASLLFFWPAGLEPVQASPGQPTGAALVERGHYLATAGDCIACHSAPNSEAFAGGRAFKLPFGTIYSSNITPDRERGIGAWSDAQFVRAMREGVDAHGRDLYPAFPYEAYANMSVDDLLAIRAYLNTLAPVHRAAPANGLIFPFNQRYLMRAWKLLNGNHRPWRPDPARSPEWNRGAYLVEGPGHCAECHTPRNLMFGLERGQGYAGAIAQGWKAYNLTSAPTGVGNWSTDDLAAYLKTGFAAGHGPASGSMSEAVSLSLRHLEPADLHAMAVYLKALPDRRSKLDAPVAAMTPPLAASTAYSPPAGELRSDTRGLRLYEGACASCHGWNGEGLLSSYGALRGAQTVNDPQAINLLQVVLHGSKLQTGQGTQMMPGFAQGLDDADVAALTNYVLAHFGDKQPTVTPQRVHQARSEGE